MAVNPDRVNEILSDFQDRVSGLIKKSGLEHHQGTTNLAEVESVKSSFTNKVMETFTFPTTTEGEIEAEMMAALDSVEGIISRLANKESSQLAAIGSIVNGGSPADSKMWNEVVKSSAHKIERISQMYAEQINNMPKSLRARIDSDFASVLDTINNEYKMNPSPANAQKQLAEATAKLNAIEANLRQAAEAVMKASIEAIVQSKITELQSLEMALLSVEKGMTKGQIDGYRQVLADTKKLIKKLSSSNYLVYDKVIRAQKLSVIDKKMAVLDNVRTGASGISQSLSGYFGNNFSRGPSRSSRSIGGVGTSIGNNTTHMDSLSGTQKNFRNGIPPGFRGFAGKISREDIVRKHPKGTAKAHIDAMEYYMSKGMSFQAAHDKASAEGYTVGDHGKVFAIGGGGQPFLV